jgi:dihydropteroate synthase
MALCENPFVVMGILNVTPDSFYDGGRYSTVDAACSRAILMKEAGADIIDVGGESSRPGAAGVSVQEEIDRVVPIIERLRRNCDVIISVDTTKSAVASQALGAGASWINDISAGRFDPEMAPTAARLACPVVLMHSRKTPVDMQVAPYYDDTMGEIYGELMHSVESFVSSGVSRSNIILDPGIGFSKRLEDNLEILRQLDSLVSAGYPVCIGASRKSFIGTITGKPAQGRLWGSLAGAAAAFYRGARIFRVHDVEETADFLKVLAAIAHE